MKFVIAAKRRDGVVRSVYCRQNNYELDVFDLLRELKTPEEADAFLDKIESDGFGDDIYSLDVIEEFDSIELMLEASESHFIDNVFCFNKQEWWYSEYDDDLNHLKKIPKG